MSQISEELWTPVAPIRPNLSSGTTGAQAFFLLRRDARTVCSAPGESGRGSPRFLIIKVTRGTGSISSPFQKLVWRAHGHLSFGDPDRDPCGLADRADERLVTRSSSSTAMDMPSIAVGYRSLRCSPTASPRARGAPILHTEPRPGRGRRAIARQHADTRELARCPGLTGLPWTTALNDRDEAAMARVERLASDVAAPARADRGRLAAAALRLRGRASAAASLSLGSSRQGLGARMPGAPVADPARAR